MTDTITIQASSPTVATPPANSVGAATPHRYREAYDRALPASQALNVDELLPINVDVKAVIATTVGKLQPILALRDEAKALPDFDISVFDQLETYTLATGHAHTTYMGASAAPEAILELNEKGSPLCRATHGA